MKRNINIDLISHLYEKILSQKTELAFLSEDVIKLNAKSFSKIKVVSRLSEKSVNEIILSDLQNVCSRLNLNVTITDVNSESSLSIGMINDKQISISDRVSADNIVNEFKKLGYSVNSQKEKSVFFGTGNFQDKIRIDNSKGLKPVQNNSNTETGGQFGNKKSKKADTAYFEHNYLGNKVISEQTILAPVPIPKHQRSNFGEKRPYEIHPGVDISVPAGTPIKSPLDGIVEVADINYNPKCGGTVDIDHGNGFWTRFCHCKEIKVKVGDIVKRGDVVAISGGIPGTIGSGNSKGAHLHWSLKKDGTKVDALAYADRVSADSFDLAKTNLPPSLKTAAGATGGLAALALVSKLSSSSSSSPDDDESFDDTETQKTVSYKEKPADVQYFPLAEQKVYSRFGEDESYYGDSILIPNEKNKKIKSPVDGKISKQRFNLGCKNQLDIVHDVNGEKYYLQYCGLKEIYSSYGNISRGETIGLTGDDDVIVSLYTIKNTKVPLSRASKFEKKDKPQKSQSTSGSKSSVHKFYFDKPKKKSDVLYFEQKIEEQIKKIKKLL